MTFNELKSISKRKKEGSPKVKVAILGDNATQLIVTALKGYGIYRDINFDIYQSDYDMINQEIYDSNSNLYQFHPEFVVHIASSEKILNKFNQISLNARDSFAEEIIEEYKNKLNILREKLNCKTIVFNFSFIDEGVFGHFSNKTRFSFSYAIRTINLHLMDMAMEDGNLFIFDIDALQNFVGIRNRIDLKFFYTAQMVFSLDVLPTIAKELTDIILAIKGIQVRKCLILDLDNTLWGGVIGDDGLDKIELGNLGIGKAFVELQTWVKSLKDRGIIICICSKNTDHIAKEPFERHPDMVLKLDDISVFIANWENKADNIRVLKEVLNIGYDSMVFLDDNPFERNLVRQELPLVTVPELPEDPTEYINYIKRLNLFETASYSLEDANRTNRYKEEAKRVGTRKSYKSISEYLRNLEMTADVCQFSDFSIPRIAQLTQRSNQFNLRTKRYTEADISHFKDNLNYLTLQISLTDKFGVYGLISVIIGERKGKDLFIDTWIMSCRVLKRNVEFFALNELVSICKIKNIERIIGERIPTAKNGIVKDHYANLGFSKDNEVWVLNLDNYKYLNNFIKKNDSR